MRMFVNLYSEAAASQVVCAPVLVSTSWDKNAMHSLKSDAVFSLTAAESVVSKWSAAKVRNSVCSHRPYIGVSSIIFLVICAYYFAPFLTYFATSGPCSTVYGWANSAAFANICKWACGIAMTNACRLVSGNKTWRWSRVLMKQSTGWRNGN